MPNSRVDHSFVFEHKLQDIGDAKYRLNVDVSGSMVSSVSPSAFIPESFNREFANIRSDNDTIAMFANFAFLGDLYASDWRRIYNYFLSYWLVEMEIIIISSSVYCYN